MTDWLAWQIFQDENVLAYFSPLSVKIIVSVYLKKFSSKNILAYLAQLSVMKRRVRLAWQIFPDKNVLAYFAPPLVTMRVLDYHEIFYLV